MLALNIMHRSLFGLFHQLDYVVGAPDGFLAVQKLVVRALGSDEHALRLFPLIAGILALVLLPFLAREVVSPRAIPLAVALFAFSDPLIYYTAYEKQYAVDVLMSVLVLWVGFRLSDRPARGLTLLLYAGVGAGAIWLSHASVFVLAGIATALVASSLARKQWRRARAISAASAVWVASFGAFALTSLHNLSGIMRSSTNPGAFAGYLSPSESLRTSLGAFRYVAGAPHFLAHGPNDVGQLVALLAAGFCTVGLISFAVDRPEKAVALLAPIGFMLTAWGFHKYPLLGRTQLFLAPSFVLLLAEGVVQTIKQPHGVWTRATVIAAAGAVGLALVVPALGQAAHPHRSEAMKPVLDYLARHQRAGDTLFVYYTAQYTFRYYLECACAGPRAEAAQTFGLWPLRPGAGGQATFAPALRSVPPRLVVARPGEGDHLPYLPDIDALQGRKRVWLLLSNIPENSARDFLLREFDLRGTRRAAFIGQQDKNSAAVYLYDMTTFGAPAGAGR